MWFLLFIIFANFVFAENELSAVIMPFHRRQFKKLMFNFGTWNIFAPAKNTNSIRPELILFVSGKDEDNFGQVIPEFFDKNPNLKQYFSSISIQFGNLTVLKDGYCRGTRLMFEAVLYKKLQFASEKVSHIFYMEPDCLPIRNYWLDAVQDEIRKESEGLIWMKGSKYQGNLKLLENASEALRQHLNGNSIYNIGSDEFREFYSNYIKPSYNYKKDISPYDLKIFEVLLMEDGKLQNKFGHHFITTKVVQNTCGKYLQWEKYLKKEAETYLVHLTNNWEEYLRFYNNNVKEEDRVNPREIFAIKV